MRSLFDYFWVRIQYTMANPDDPDFDTFVSGIMNASFSSAFNGDEMEDEDDENIILHNLSESDADSDVDMDSVPNIPNNNSGRPTFTTNSRNRNQIIQQTSGWNLVTNNDPGPSRIIPIYNVNRGPVLPECFDHETKPVEFFLFFSMMKLSSTFAMRQIYLQTRKNN